ncbi:hypothetical protein PXU57_001915 [Salmonella enterica subsp. enterica]|nr:hypothetical protein [Salmonella enterica subsp. enterica]
MGKTRIIKATSSVVKPPTGGFFVPLIHTPVMSVNFPVLFTVKNIGSGISASIAVIVLPPSRTMLANTKRQVNQPVKFINLYKKY